MVVYYILTQVVEKDVLQARRLSGPEIGIRRQRENVPWRVGLLAKGVHLHSRYHWRGLRTIFRRKRGYERLQVRPHRD